MVRMDLMIGRVVKSHGVKGEVAVDVTTDDPDARFAVGEVLQGKQGNKEHTLTIASVRPHQARLLVRFEEIPDRTAADSLRGTKFFAPPLDDADDDGFYEHELLGLRVIHDGADIGEVTALQPGVAHSLLEFSGAEGSTGLIPFVEEMVPEVDLEAGTVTVTPPEGLLDL